MRPATGAAFVLSAVFFAACTRAGGGAEGPKRHSWTRPGVLRVAIQSDLENLNPLLSSSATDVFVDRLMFEPLITADPKGRPLPMLATVVPTLGNGGVSADGLTVTYHLRHNVHWSDGVPVTSRDVKWSWQALMNPANDVVSRNGYDDVASIDTHGRYTVVVHLKQKFAPFVNTFFAESDQPFMIAPAHVLAKYPNINAIPFNSRPNVTDGPFRFARWARGDSISLTGNEAFFLGKPSLQRIEIKVIPDEDTSVNLLSTHAIDYMFEASIATYPSIRSLSGIRIAWLNANGYSYVTLNCARPFLTDPRVRLALAYAIDKAQLVRTEAFGTQTVATEDIPDWMWAFNPRVKAYPHDTAAAARLLREAGWAPGADGILRKGGRRLELLLVTNNSNATRRRESLEIQAMLRTVGIDSAIKSYPVDVLFAPAGTGGILQLGRFDLTNSGWFAGIDPDDSSQLTCENFPPQGFNDSRYCDPQMQAAQRAALTQYGRASRKAAYDRIQELLARDNPNIYIYWERQMEPVSVDFKGFDPNPVTESWNAWRWSL